MPLDSPPASLAKTVIYIHGIGNKPIESVLKCQWDKALFGLPMGEKTRLAYWVNRELHGPPTADTCAAADLVDAGTESSTSIRAAAEESPSELVRKMNLSPAQSKRLTAIAAKMAAAEIATSPPAIVAEDLSAKVLPLPPFLRRIITRRLTKKFLLDVNDFFYDEAKREAMRKSLRDRIVAGGGPFVIIAHSQGSMIAFHVLRELSKAQCDVKLFVTIGSPLGLKEVQDQFHEWFGDGVLTKPACVDDWLNVADRLDPVALDNDLTNDFKPQGAIRNESGFGANADSPRHPHSGSGYLQNKHVRKAVFAAVGNQFAQGVTKFVIARDLANDLEDSQAAQRNRVLIQLKRSESEQTIDEMRTAVMGRLKTLLGDDYPVAEVDPLKRYVSAFLTRFEVETIASEFKSLSIEHVWRDAVKSAQIYESANTVQARPANRSYGATGRKIHWAVLDTGVAADHPHFATHSNIVAQWDCSKVGPPAQRPLNVPTDDHGHGTHVAGIIAGGWQVEMPEGAAMVPVQMEGMAPEAKLHIYKVLNEEGEGNDSWMIKALDHIAEVNENAGEIVIHGLNLSLGGNFDPSVFGTGHTPLCEEIRRLWRQGVIVCIAAGNDGYAVLQAENGAIGANLDLSIGDPANLEEAIAVGSVHKSKPQTYGISYFSSRGPTADGRQKPDVVAPGEKIVSACHRFPRDQRPEDLKFDDLYLSMSGTSMATPHVSGILAAFLSVRREFIGEPDRVKQILLDQCVDLKRDPYMQGHGLPNLIKMLALN